MIDDPQQFIPGLAAGGGLWAAFRLGRAALAAIRNVRADRAQRERDKHAELDELRDTVARLNERLGAIALPPPSTHPEPPEGQGGAP
jgi:hypothetical protein